MFGIKIRPSKREKSGIEKMARDNFRGMIIMPVRSQYRPPLELSTIQTGWLDLANIPEEYLSYSSMLQISRVERVKKPRISVYCRSDEGWNWELQFKARQREYAYFDRLLTKAGL